MKRKILIVEDEEINRRLLHMILGGEYELIEATGGRQALEILHARYRVISAVLLDLAMPELSGFEVLRCMRDSRALSQIPVIVTTSSSDVDSEVKALSLGANDCVAKPYNPALIRHSLRNTINLRETASIVNVLQKDKLTGLYNREAFFEKALSMIREREPGYYLMSSFDINNFKLINDQYGAAKGDSVLQYIGKALMSDMEIIDGIGCRISADNFAALYPTSKKDKDYVSQMQNRELLPAALQSTTAFSVGRYIVTDLTLSAGAMYDRAYIAKQSVKGRYDEHIAYFDEAMREKLLQEQEIIGEMDSALAEKQFEVWFQPQFNHATGALIGAEALVRWRHPQKGMIQPGRFIPVFEQNGFIYELDKYVWDETCRCLRRWLDEGRNPLPVSVNISRYDVFRPDLEDVIFGLMRKYDLPIELLRLEITESAFARSTEQIITVVKSLMDRGFTLEIDDFGSGYSSLNTLKDVPANVLKLDMRFLENNENSQRGGSILESVVRMARWLGMSVIAEGVETRRQADFLKSIGCNYVQGYLYARPMPVQEYERLAKNAGKEERLLVMETVDHLNSDTFWDPKSMDTLIFNSFVGGACIFEYHRGVIELLRVNDKYAHVIGGPNMSTDNVMKLNWSEHLDETNNALLADALRRSVESGEEVTEDVVLTGLPGCPRETYLRSAMRVIASSGERYLVYCTNENMTAQREAEERERSASARERAIMNNVGCGITAVVASESQPRFLFSNDRYYDLLGYTRAQYQQEVKNPFDTIHPGDRELLRMAAEAVGATDLPIALDYRALRRDGSTAWLRSTISSTRFADVDGPVQLCIYTDVTAEKRSEQELDETDAQLRFLNDTTHDLLAQPDAVRGVEDVLHKLLDYFGAGRAYVFEFHYDRQTAENTFEVCAQGVASEQNNLRAVPLEVMSFWLHAFDSNSYISIENVSALDDSRAEERRILSAQGITSLIAVPLRRDGALVGFIGVDNPIRQQNRVDRLDSIGDYISVMLDRRELNARITSDNEAMLDLMSDTPGGFVRMKVLPEGRIVPLYFNEGFCRLMGMDRDALMKIYADDALAGVHPEDVGVVLEAVDAMLKNGEAYSSKYRLIHASGEYVYMMIFGRMTKNESGDTFLNIYYTDVSAQSREDEQLRELLDNLPCGAALLEVADGKLTTLHLNRRYKELVGREFGDFSEVDVASALREEDRRQMMDEIAVAIDKGRDVQCDLQILCGDGRYKPFHVVARVVPKGDGVHSLYTTYSPISDEAAVYYAAFGRLKLLTDNIPGGVATYSCAPGPFTQDNPHITYFNDGLCRLFGYTREEFEKFSVWGPVSLVFKEDLHVLKEQHEALIENGTPVECVYRAHVKGGGQKWIKHRAAATDWQGDAIIVNAALFDVTEEQENSERLRVSEEEYRMATRHSGSIICRFSIPERTLSIPAAAAERLGLPETVHDLPPGAELFDKISPDTAEDYIQFYQRLIDGERDASVTFRQRLSGQWRWLEASASVINSASGNPTSAVISFWDITEQLEKEAVYKKWQQSMCERDPASYTLFRSNISKNASFDTMDGLLLNYELSDKLMSFNERTLEYAESSVYEEDRETYIAVLNSDTLLANYYRGMRTTTLDYREKLPEGGVRWLRLTAELVEYPNTRDIEAYLMFENIDASKRAELLNIQRAETDPLTGVLNRTTFKANVEKLIRASGPEVQHALMMLDIDGFKQVNDVFGHAAGDQALIEITDSLRSVLRRGDLLCRLGGDEFLVLMSDIPNTAAAARKARQICAVTGRAFSMEVRISVSVGVAVSPRDGVSFDTLYRRADAALYHVKGAGKNDYAFYHENMSDGHPEPEEECAASRAENERLRAQNSYLELRGEEVRKYRVVMARMGLAVVEQDWRSGLCTYDDVIPRLLAGSYDDRPIWQILLVDRVAEASDVKAMRGVVNDLVNDPALDEASEQLRLRTPSGEMHLFRMNVYKQTDDLRLTDKLIYTLADLGPEAQA